MYCENQFVNILYVNHLSQNRVKLRKKGYIEPIIANTFPSIMDVLVKEELIERIKG
jgi:hypothetical protein